MQIKDFLNWIKLKEKLYNNENNNPLIKDGEIWWVSMGENINHEINGKGKRFCRPVLVYKKISRSTFMGYPSPPRKRREAGMFQ